ncbi:response regulator [candidate division KSB1 bacterium]|nr:response regulator [candidate division KSB1 bacterium]
MIKLNTLVVDDELGMRLSVKRALSKFVMQLPDVDDEIGFDVDVAETGEEALDKIKSNRPDILLLDYKLPGISGLDILEKVTSQESEMLSIMITAYASIETAVTAVKQGAFDFLAKPFTPDELKNTVSKAARRLILARQVKKLAQERRQVRFQFISVLGHELKSPLNSIDGYLDIMKQKKLGGDIASYEPMIDRCTVRIEGMRKLIMDLLDLTRIESGQKKRELKEIDIVEIANHTIETNLPLAEKRDITIENHASDPIYLNGDANEIEIICNNLISNAIKYNVDGGRVDVYINPADRQIEIAVADTGIGMSESEVAKLFNEFVRIKNDKTKAITGSGLGLAIVKKIALLYNGDVSVSSEPNVGSRFSVKLDSNLTK